MKIDESLQIFTDSQKIIGKQNTFEKKTNKKKYNKTIGGRSWLPSYLSEPRKAGLLLEGRCSSLRALPGAALRGSP